MARFLTQEFDLAPNDVVEVTLHGCESDMFLVDFHNFCAFRRGSGFSYHGGHYRSSPVRLMAPHQGRWHLVILPTGGTVRTSTRVLRYAA